ncbi:Gldg family protein [Sphingobacterium oryzagri]|uniref:Gldg family protein n=1 Tax=Sphingobacterium oryzagri TaxID=3025669 RepID=A0ABY7WL28_9SPHI|nr:Gldg family protein [Sphingobacterium sp. KACC 22765]WDF70311.1 Gldg family protein [Sphingobacterium sp. KACC 22765]
MKTTLRIAKIELSQLFYSPVAWIVLIVLIVQAGWQYHSTLERIYQGQEMGQSVAGATMRIFSGFRSLFPQMQEYLYLYIPLLTMGLISRETSSGSIKLLYSSPIKVSEIIIGKYLAMMAYCLILIGVFLGLGLLSLFTIKNSEFTLILSGIIGLYLLICSYAAIGLFMSSLTTYQVVAAISTLVVLAALNFIGGLWQDIAFVRDITYFLSISGRVEESINGLLGSNDIFYFLIVITLFLGLTYLKLQFERQTLTAINKAVRYAGFIAIMLLIGYVTSLPQFIVYKDMTANKTRTLTPASQAIIKQFEEPVHITTYVNLLDDNYYSGLPASHNSDKKRFDMYLRYMPYLKMDYVYYWDHSTNERLYKENPGASDEEIARKMAKINKLPFSMFLTPAQIKEQINLTPERNRFVRKLTYKDKQVYLRVYDDMFRHPNEKETSAAFKRLLVPAPKVAFVTGHNERSIQRSGDRDYQVATTEIAFRYALVNQGFDVESIELKQLTAGSKVNILVIADPMQAFDQEELRSLQNYIDNGGNLLILAEPEHKAFIDPILSLLHVQMDNGLMVQQSANYERDFILANVSKANWLETVGESSFLHNDSVFVSMPTATALSVLPNSPFVSRPLLVTQAASTWKQNDLQIDRNQPLLDVRSNEQKKSFPLALALTRKVKNDEQRVLVVGDADFINNAELMRQSPRTANFSVMTDLFRWFSANEYPIETTREQPIDVGNVNATQLELIKWGWLAVLPILIAGSVITVLIRRKRR